MFSSGRLGLPEIGAAKAPISPSLVVRSHRTQRTPSSLLHPALRGRDIAPSTSRRGIAPRLAASSSSPVPTSPPDAHAPSGPVLLWFKHDLRVDDHPGLHAALASGRPLVPFFCFDPERYEAVAGTPAGAAALSQAVSSLRAALRELGSDLFVACGRWEDQVPAAVAAVGAASIIAEEELEWGWRDGFTAVAEVLQDTSKGNGGKEAPKIESWAAPLFESGSGADTFDEWCKQRGEAVSPVPAPASLPSPPSKAASLFASELLPPAELLEHVRRAQAAATDPALAGMIEAAGASEEMRWARSAVFSSSDSDGDVVPGAGRVINALPGDPSTSETIADVETALAGAGADWGAEIAAELAAGEGPVMAALSSYLQHVETAADGGGAEWQWRLGAAIAQYDVPAAPDGCFPALFGRALALGVVSPRRVYSEAVAQLEAAGARDPPPPPGLLGKIGWLLSSDGGAAVRTRRARKAAAAAAAAEAGAFHTALAAAREGAEMHGAVLRHWRWRGIITDFLVATPATPRPGAPAVLLCHGFGAFSSHWRDNVAALAAQGYTVYAPTLPGYGRAEKPSVPYGQGLWRDFLADFVLHVVRQPVVAAGNSIGGFIAASLAADFPGAVAGLVLVNSAGLLQEGYRPPPTPPTSPSPPLFIVEGVSRALFSFLQGDVTRQLRRVYPVAPERADEWLGGEISRASSDPGALGVFRSVFYLPKPRALNFLVAEAFGGPTLVLQGAKDPLNDAVGRAKDLDRLCGNVRVVMLDAGHCPHDEVPDQWNAEMARFLEDFGSVGERKAVGAGKSGAGSAAA